MSGIGIKEATTLMTVVITGIPVIIYALKFRNGKETFGWAEKDVESDKGKFGYDSAGEAVESARKVIGGGGDE